jgi:hypothetical protein
MHACHTQARRQFRVITSKALVNRTRMKVVNIALTKNFRHGRATYKTLRRRPRAGGDP